MVKLQIFCIFTPTYLERNDQIWLVENFQMGWFNHQPNSRLGLWDDAWWIGSSWWWCAGGFANFRQVKGGKKGEVYYIWSNYSDLLWWFCKENGTPKISGKSRLVKYSFIWSDYIPSLKLTASKSPWKLMAKEVGSLSFLGALAYFQGCWLLVFRGVSGCNDCIILYIYNWAMKKPWLVRLYRGWKTTQLYRDYNKPL